MTEVPMLVCESFFKFAKDLVFFHFLPPVKRKQQIEKRIGVTTMRDDIIHLPTDFVEIPFCLPNLGKIRNFLVPDALPLRANFLVVRFRASECKNRISFDIEYLTSHQMNDIRSDHLNFAAVPIADGVLLQSSVVFVITINE